MKLNYKQARPFERGMYEGAHRLFKESPSIVASKCGFAQKRDCEAFQAGYNLAYSNDMYFFAWKANNNLLAIALRSGDIKPIGWELYNGHIETI